MKLVKILRCPECMQELKQREEYLVCSRCGARYPVIEGIPVMRVGGEKNAYEDIEHAKIFDAQRTGNEQDLRRRTLMLRIAELARIREDTKVLSVGAGTGLNEQYLNCDLVTSDYSLAMLTLARQKGLKKIVCADALRLPFQESEFDCVISFGCSTILHAESAIVTIREMKRVVKKPGQLIVVFQNIIFNRISGALRHANYRYDEHGVSPAFLARLFKQQGITVASSFTYVSSDRELYSATNKFFDWLRLPLGPTIVIQGRV